jgi:hypothetical protein
MPGPSQCDCIHSIIELIKYIHDTPKVKMWCGRTLLFVEGTMTGDIYLDLSKQFVLPEADNTE